MIKEFYFAEYEKGNVKEFVGVMFTKGVKLQILYANGYTDVEISENLIKNI